MENIPDLENMTEMEMGRGPGHRGPAVVFPIHVPRPCVCSWPRLHGACALPGQTQEVLASHSRICGALLSASHIVTLFTPSGTSKLAIESAV